MDGSNGLVTKKNHYIGWYNMAQQDTFLDRIKRLQPNTIDLDYLDETFRKVTGFSGENETVIIME